MNFWEAMEALKAGKNVKRKAWEETYLFMIDGEDMRRAMAGAYAECVIMTTIAVYTKDPDGQEEILFGWLASQPDMLGNDWEIVNE